MKLYAYCLCAVLDSFDNSVSGVSGAAVRVLKFGGVSVPVSDCEAVPATRENLLAHAAVVRTVFTRTTTVPFRFGTLATEQQLRSFVTTNKLAIANKLEHLRGCIEMDLKTKWQSSGSAEPNKQDPAAGPGTAFLMEKRRELLGDEQTAAQRGELSVLLRTELGNLIRDETIILQAEKAEKAKVFHLVEAAKIKQYRETVQELSEKRPELELEVSGPWPPYSFANIELELPLHFGVS